MAAGVGLAGVGIDRLPPRIIRIIVVGSFA
jgi:hypothetical protein